MLGESEDIYKLFKKLLKKWDILMEFVCVEVKRVFGFRGGDGRFFFLLFIFVEFV